MWKRVLVLALALLVLDQIVQYTVLRDGFFLGRRVAPFDPPVFNARQREHLARVDAVIAGRIRASDTLFDPDLGWCPIPGQARPVDLCVYDWAGCRVCNAPLARERDRTVRRVVATGGSFTLGAEVEGPDSWVGRLDSRADLEVANLAVGGYGLDQALLRLRRDGRRLEPDEVWIGFLPAGVERITTHFPPLAHHWSSLAAFKPAFRLDAGGELELVPSPARTFADHARLLSDQHALIAAIGGSDHWILRRPAAYAPRGSSWLHRLACGRLLLTWLEAGGREPAELLGGSDRSTFLLARALFEELDREARSMGAALRVLVLPAQSDLRWTKEHGRRYWDELARAVADRGVPVLDATDALLSAGALDDRFWMPAGHYGPEANAVVAQTAAAAWLP